MADHTEREQLQKLEDEKNAQAVKQAQENAKQEVETEPVSSPTDEDVGLDDEGVTY